MKVKCFAPGHISGFFEPVYHPENVFRTGSRGAGLSISLGATSEVFVKESDRQVFEFFINDKKSDAPVTDLAFKYLLGQTRIHVVVKTKLDLPLGQGFGMSAAGTLSSTMALAKLLQLPTDEALKASHYAEVQMRTGLGDALASWFGGLEIRKAPGLPPWGLIEHIPGGFNAVLCIVDQEIDTRAVLSDADKLNKITAYGNYCTRKILEKPSVENLLRLSRSFAKKTGLAGEKVVEAIDAADRFGKASMCMLGNSVFAVGETDKLCNVLSEYGRVFTADIDKRGARFL